MVYSVYITNPLLFWPILLQKSRIRATPIGMNSIRLKESTFFNRDYDKVLPLEQAFDQKQIVAECQLILHPDHFKILTAF